jgi:hypothetical protein
MTKWYEENLQKVACYNKHRKNIFADLQELYKKYLSGDLGGNGEPELPPTEQPVFNVNLYNESFEQWGFEDNFEVEWFKENQYSSLITENFNWMEQIGEYENSLIDSFQNNWFVLNQYLNTLTLDLFDNLWFTINNYNSSLFTENFEGVWI